MARPRTSRSPSPAGSQQSSRRNRKDGERRDHGGSSSRDKPRDRPRRSRSPAERRYRDRDRDRDHDSYRRRDRSLDRRDEDDYRGGRRDGNTHRDRRRSHDRGDRGGGRDTRHRSPPRRRSRSRDRDRDYRPRRDDDSDRNRGRGEGTADSGHRNRGDDHRPRGPNSLDGGRLKEPDPAKPLQTPDQLEAEKKAERRAQLAKKVEEWKKKKEMGQRKESEATPGSTRQLLAMMDEKVGGVPVGAASPSSLVLTPAAASPGTPHSLTAQEPSPVIPYGGKFDPKAIAKRSTTRHQSPPVLGAIQGRPLDVPVSTSFSKSTASSLPQGKPVSGFGFHRSAADQDRGPSKRTLNLDDEETSNRKLAKLPDMSLETTDDVPYVNQDEDDDDSDGDNFAGTEEEAAAAARAAHDRREERILQQSMAMETDQDKVVADADRTEPAANGAEASQGQNEIPTEAEVQAEVEAEAEAEARVQFQTQVEARAQAQAEAQAPIPSQNDAMDVDEKEEDEDVDPLDAFMADLEQPGLGRGGTKNAPPISADNATARPKEPAPEAYFSDDNEFGTSTKEGADANPFLAIAAKRKKKEIPSIDYSKIDLVPVRKNFWVEPYELSEMSEEEVAELRLELDGIKVSGKNVPKPVQKWSLCGLTRPILDVIEKLQYEKPTSIQMQALPAIMSGRDIVGVAKTGSGKTMAFLLPMFRHIKDQAPVKDNEGPIGLVLTPTRELAVQIHRDCKPFLKTLGLRAVCAYGGPPIKDQIAELKRGAEIVVATTGRMIDLLAANQGRVINLRRTSYIVLDEADRMFDMGFEPQVMKIFANVRPDRQTVLFSATMPKIMDALVKKFLKSPIEIEVGGKSVVAPEITQMVEIRAEKDKFNRLLELLGDLYRDDDDVRSLIFVERQEKADDLLRELLRRGYGCMSLHGGKDQIDRDSTIVDFKSGVCPVLIATSVAARGLDVKQLKLVVNYDAPNHLEDYVHRAGRTGRAGNTGTAVTFITEEQENCAVGIAKALEQSGQPVPERLAEMRKAFREKVKSGKAKDQSGFGGKGLEKLDKEREAARVRERKTHKAEGEDDDVPEEKQHKKGADKKDQVATSAIQIAASVIVSRDVARAEAEAAKSAAIHEVAAAAAAKGGAMEKAASAISDINARLARAGQLRPGQPIDNKGPDAGAFHATLEINDFPQKARWAVTNRTNVARILEATGTSITTKGTYYAPGKEPTAGGEPKLYILIEGDTEIVVSTAMEELKRLLVNATVQVADAESRAPVSGRYSVV